MSLNHEGVYNDLSPKLRTELEEKVLGFGKKVRYKFNIGNINPDPDKKDGQIIWQRKWTLDPAVFSILDPYEDRKDKQKSKKIGLIIHVEYKDGHPIYRFGKAVVEERMRGILELNLEILEHREMAMYLEIHPKLSGGMFVDTSKQQIFSRIDENKAATEAREARSARSKARKLAEEMSEKDIITFALAMQWDSGEEEIVLRNRIEDLAETNPEFFNGLLSGKEIEFRGLVQLALNKGVIEFDPAIYGMIWKGNRQTITILSPAGEKTENEKFSEWLQGTGKQGEEVTKKLKELTGSKKEAVA